VITPRSRRADARSPVRDADPAHVIAAARAIVTMLNEVAVGVRPARVICPLFAVHLRDRIRRTRPQPGPVPGVRRLVVSPAVGGAYEVVAVSHRDGRFAAVSLRLEDAGHGWMVTDLARPAVTSRRMPPPLSDAPGDPASAVDRRG
jgi:hypothetical protein